MLDINQNKSQNKTQYKRNFFTVLIVIMASSLHLMAQQAAATPQQPPGWMQAVPFFVIIVVMYFLMIRPQAKKHKEQINFLDSLKMGDLVVTQSGLLGKITGLTNAVVNLEISQGVQIKILKSQIQMFQDQLKSLTEAKK